MKTSNKLLIGFYCLMLVLTLTGMVIFKNNMIISFDEKVKGSGQLTTNLLAEEYQSDSLILDSDYHYFLDPSRQDISVTCDDNLNSKFKLSDKGIIRFYQEGDLELIPSQPIKITIGVKGKQRLFVEAKHRSYIKNLGSISKDLEINAEDGAEVDLKGEFDELELRASNGAEVHLAGNAKSMLLNVEDRSRVEGQNFTIGYLKMNAEDKSISTFDRVDTLNIAMEDRSKLHLNQKWKVASQLSKDDKAAIIINGELMER